MVEAGSKAAGSTPPKEASISGGARPATPDYRRFAGRVLFPRSFSDLSSTTQCPACQVTLVAMTCLACDLDLTHPAASEIVTLSRDAVTLLDRRLEVIGTIRWDTAQARSAAAMAAEERDAATAKDNRTNTIVAPVPLPRIASNTGTSPNHSAPPEVPVETATATAAAPPPRRSSVQVILLIVGISLLSVAAVFFLVYAFINFGILGRSLIIAAVTVASFAIASSLRRRSLSATAEGIAVLSVVLVYLDAFAIRANDFFGTGRTDGATFWGAALVLTAAGFLAWHRLSGLRTANIVGFSAIVPGVALVVGGLSQSADDGSRLFIAFASATLAGAVHHWARRPATATHPAFEGRPERFIVRGLTGIALFGALVAASAVAPSQPWASTPAFLAVAGLAALHAWLIGRSSPEEPTLSAAFFAGIGGAAAAVSVASGALRLGDLNVTVIAPPVAAAFIALGLELLWRRSSGATGAAASPRQSALIATIAAATVAGVTLLFPLAVAVESTATAVSHALASAWTLAPQDPLVQRTAIHGLAVAALALFCLMATAAWSMGKTLRRRASLPAWFGAAVLIMAVPLLPGLTAVLAGWLVLATAALGALLASHRGDFAPHLRAPLLVLLATSGTLGYLVGWGSTATWWIGSIVVVGLLLIGRLVPASPLGRATALGASAIVVLIGAAAAARQLALPALPAFTPDADNAFRAVSIIAIALLALCAFPLHAGFSSLDRRVVFWIGGAAAALSFVGLSLSVGGLSPHDRVSLLLPEPVTSLSVNTALLAVLLIVVIRPVDTRLRWERLAASVALAPTLSLVVDAFAGVIDLPELARSVGSISAALFAAVGVLIATVLRSRGPAHLAGEPHPGFLVGERRPRELGILLVAVPSVVIGVARHDAVTWLVLVFAALVMLILATSPDGLVGSSSPRRYLGWGAFALATAGLWWRLGDSRVTDLEPYVLPLAGMLLLVALFAWRANRSTAASTPDPVTPVITLAALLMAILPLGAVAASGPLLRAVVVAAVSAALLIAGSSLLGTSRSRWYLDALALAGVLGTLTVVIGRGASLHSQSGTPDIRLDAWLGSGFLVLIISAFGQARTRSHGTNNTGRRMIASQVLVAVGLAVVLEFELTAFEDSALGSLRAIAVILLLCALHVISFLIDRAPFTQAVGWIAIAGAAIAVIGALLTGAIHPVELGTIPIAGALVITGALTLSRAPTARTWPWLAPGVAVLLVPSLIATADHPPLWRLVGLGVVGVTIIITSAVLRLQAPFLLAVVVVLIHAIATFAPQIRAVYESVEWWLWFVPVGIAVVVFAARFEKSVLRMRSVAMRIRALR